MVFNPNNYDNAGKKSRAYYHRLATGLRIANYRNMPMRFMTLTSAKEGKWYRGHDGTEKERTIKQSWAALRKRIKKQYGWNLNKYICFRTREGNGVLHIVFWGGKFIPQDWLSKQWKQIHNAEVVDIRFIHKLKSNVNRLVGYLLDRYLLGQPIERMSYGWGWAWLGFCKSWKVIKERYNMMRKGQYSFDIHGELLYDQYTKMHDLFYTKKTVSIVPFKKKYSNKCVSAWKSILGNERVTSRQKLLTKFF